MRSHSLIDQLCLHADTVLKTLTNTHQTSRQVKSPTHTAELSATDAKHAAALMRINHTGEVCAQALYQGQSITARSNTTKQELRTAQLEEVDHLAWCSQRVQQLGSHTSYFNPLWYLGALSIGMVFGLIGDKASLGFLAETENQVVAHLNTHLELLPSQDEVSRAIVQQMIIDEAKHEHTAKNLGGVDLPYPITQAMKFSAKIMTSTVYYA